LKKYLMRLDQRLINNILIIRFGGLGDILHSTPILRAIKSKFPSCRITYLLGKGSERILEDNPNIDDIIIFDKRNRDKGLRGLLRLISSIKSNNYDLIINLHPSFRTFMILLFSGAKFKIIYKKDKEPKGKVKVRHAIDNIADVLLPLNVELKTKNMDLIVREEETFNINRLLKDKGINNSDRIIVINPSSTHKVNRWSEKNFAELSDILIDRGIYKVVLASAPNEIDIIKNIKSYMKNEPIDLSGIDLNLLISLLKRADLVISGDTGPLHMAVALNTKVVGIYGPTDPYRTGPISGDSIVIYKNELDCVPCRKRYCDKSHECMNMISPKEVFEEIERIKEI